MIKAPGSRFLNVDMNIISRVPLDPLVQAFGKMVDVLYVGGSGRRFEAHVELAGSGYRENAESLIRRLVALVTQLRGDARKLWNGAQAREFNVGIEAAAGSRPFELRLQPETLAAVAGVSGRVAITVYGPATPKALRVGHRQRGRRRLTRDAAGRTNPPSR